MGVDPQTHEPFTSQHQYPSATSSSRHMAQWESARLEAEARLSRECSLFAPPSSALAQPNSDLFLRLWNSEVGDSFRNLQGRGVDEDDDDVASSSSTKCGSASAVTTEAATLAVGKKEDEEEDESELQLLLDFPMINNDMSFLSENSFICPL